MTTSGLTLWAAIGPLAGSVLGIVLGHVLSRSWQFKQWKLENRRQEYREVLTALATAYTAMQRYIVEPMRWNMRVDLSEQTESERRLEEAKLESFRVLQDRIVIARELELEDIIGRWADAFHNFEHTPDDRKFADRYFKIRDTVVKMARNERPYWQPWYVRMRRRLDGTVWSWKKRRRDKAGS
jgi:hypothetical protein